MAFGFGFNKAKVLASAEKFVQQGKLQNAITEYEKIIEKDAKDLTVLNTIGDLYARLGQAEKAGEYFKQVGDSYATDGFTVKAIAMYKKLTKLNPSTATVQRLAELYTQQGLYNDARQQYLQLADSFVKSSDLTGATKVFQKMLEIDPDNVSLQSKLADLYVRMGKKNEASDIFMRAATSLFDRGSVDQADVALDKMLSLDPSNSEALLMRGKIAMDAGDGTAAVRYLEKVPNIDSKPDGLQALLKAEILIGNAQGAEAVARKLATVHNDLSGVRAYASFLLAAGRGEAVLAVYSEFADRLLVGDTGELLLALQGLAGQLKDNPASLEQLRTVFQKAGATGNIPEVNELLAHAYVKTGELAKARDLYKELAELEPSNPVHMQNYRQVMAKLGEEPVARTLSAAEGEQAFFGEEIQAPPLQQEYDPALKEEIDNALAEAELCESYNKPAQAVPRLKSVLTKAPSDARLNQRLVSVYQRLGNAGEAARCCDKLRAVYDSFGLSNQAQAYAEMAQKFRAQLHEQKPVAESIPQPAPTPVTRAPQFSTSSVDFAAQTSEIQLPAAPIDIGEAHEIDLSEEWEAVVDQPAAPEPAPASQSQPAPAPPEIVVAEEPEFEVTAPEAHPSMVADLLEEIRFYLAQSMWDEARSAIARCEQLAQPTTELIELKMQLESALAGGAVEPPVEVELEETAPAEAGDGTVSELDFSAASETTPPAEEPISHFDVMPPEVEEPAIEKEPVAETQVAEVDLGAAVEPVPPQPVSAPELVSKEHEPVETEKTIERELPFSPTPPVRVPPATAAPPVPPRPQIATPEIAPAAAAETKDVLADLVLDLESALGDDFGAPAATAPSRTVAASAAASAIGSAAPPVVPVPVAATAPSAAPAAVASEPVLNASEASSALSDLFEEFKEEVGEPAEEKEDPETHYSLGVAFKEMGLLDEAIGELQKVCRAIDHGAEFSQTMQAYTWLASCFVDKGVPEAGLRWYEKALTLPSSDESRTALHYDLAAAYEAAGDKRMALKHFTEVYGSNIDYRDVAERIKALKS
jgi:tetratricopeptide (TPR) repeat protein